MKSIYLVLACSLSALGRQSPEVAKLQALVERNQKILSDWPNLARYRDENAKVAQPAPNEKRVVFMSDSITDAGDEDTAGFFRASLI